MTTGVAFPLPGGGALAGALLYGVLSSTIPVFNAEIYIVAAAALLPRAMQPAIVLCFVVGTMIGKAGLYIGADHLVRRAPPNVAERVAGWVERLQQHRRPLWLLLFAGAAVGVPPFYVLSLAAGTLRVGLTAFCVLGTAGYLLRYSALTWAAGALAWLLR